jgi:molybdopterin-guanine dinucleotide biosynthesis protein A
MPFPDKTIITDQINEFNKGEHDVIIPKVGRYIEPLHAIYSKSVLIDIEKFISEGKSRAVRDFLREVDVGYLKVARTEKSKLAFTNINSPEDIDKIIV